MSQVDNLGKNIPGRGKKVLYKILRQDGIQVTARRLIGLESRGKGESVRDDVRVNRRPNRAGRCKPQSELSVLHKVEAFGEQRSNIILSTFERVIP